MEIKRGYVKWVDKEGVMHKEPLHLHPELLATASDKQKQYVEEILASTTTEEKQEEEQKELLLDDKIVEPETTKKKGLLK
jgi:hypothetical protein